MASELPSCPPAEKPASTFNPPPRPNSLKHPRAPAPAPPTPPPLSAWKTAARPRAPAKASSNRTSLKFSIRSCLAWMNSKRLVHSLLRPRAISIIVGLHASTAAEGARAARVRHPGLLGPGRRPLCTSQLACAAALPESLQERHKMVQSFRWQQSFAGGGREAAASGWSASASRPRTHMQPARHARLAALWLPPRTHMQPARYAHTERKRRRRRRRRTAGCRGTGGPPRSSCGPAGQTSWRRSRLWHSGGSEARRKLGHWRQGSAHASWRSVGVKGGSGGRGHAARMRGGYGEQLR